MNSHHAALLGEIKCLAKTQPFECKHSDSYGGHNEKTYKISNPQLRKVIKSWISKNRNLTLDELIDLLNSIYLKSDSSTEKYLGGYLIEYLPKLRKHINPQLLDRWLNHLTGWSQIDSLCQSKFSSADMQSNWEDWEKTIKSFNNSHNVSKLRASLVLLTGPVREARNDMFAKLAFENIDNLKSEKDILITKAISWLLRDMIKWHRNEVEQYLVTNGAFLPKIAVRETKRKLTTGRK
ncbi:DNA alkylation repair protein [Patescibacteria group bacterium]|nr:DNA alkylation repair protein [Patescibacteria group bacterium]MBU1970523.1 DNA alkylation repair protein [Patescibacteria group bacterium]